MTKQVQRRRGTATQHTSFTGAEGELSVNTTNKSVHVHDNVTAGGFEAARADMDNVTSSSILTAAGITATTAELNYVDGVTSNIQTQLDGKAGTASPTFTGTLTTANLTATGTTTLAGASTSADITFGDNDKAIFGAGSDLQIYHDGSNSYISDVGAGNLNIQGNNLLLEDPNGVNFLGGNGSTGAVTVYYSGAARLATTSTGIDVTGTITADGLTSSAVITAQEGRSNTAGTGQIVIDPDDTTVSAAFRLDQADNKLNIDMTNAGTWQKKLSVYTGGDISFYEDTGTTAKFFWDASAERLGIGTSSPSSTLEVKGANNSDAILTVTGGTTAGLGSNAKIKLVPDGTAGLGVINVEGSDGSDVLAFQTNGSEAMRIDSSGNVGIGESSPQGRLHLKKTDTGNSPQNPAGNQLVIENGDSSGSADIQFLSASNGYNHIFFGDAADANVGVLLYDHTNNSMQFQVNTSEAMRLDSSGNLLVGKTSTGIGTAGIQAEATGQLNVTKSGDAAVRAIRLSSDGDIVKFYKDSTTVGSIGVKSDRLAITDNTYGGIVFANGGNGVLPAVNDGTPTDNTIDLGNSAFGWKDLYLSGGVYLGGTGAANKLDDYESGTWTPIISTSGANITYSGQNGHYTKIGREVFLNWQINISGLTSVGTGNFGIGGLPFTQTVGKNYGRFVIQTYYVNVDSNAIGIYAYAAGGTQLGVLYSYDNSGWAVATSSSFNISGSTVMSGSFHYISE